MELKVPPVVVFLLALALILGCHYLSPDFSFNIPYRRTLSRVLLFSGALSGVLGIVAFRSSQTTVDPTKPHKASSLVTKGIYQYTRNPMYLGMALVLIGGIVRLGNPIGLLGLVFFVGYITEFQIKPEEKILKEIFGEDYSNYCLKVRRWV